jgi:hypothetical protein
MKRVVDGKLYDTETAELLATDENCLSWSDFRQYCVELYRTQKGTWFTVSDAGPRSKYSNGGDCWIRDVFAVLGDVEAREFLNAHSDADTVMRFFEVTEG